jgi:hypothetical protein
MLRKRKHQIIAYIFAIVGIVMLYQALGWTLTQYDFVTNSDTTEGRVVELVERKSDKGYLYAPRVEFISKENETVTFISGLYSNPARYREGQAVPVRYSQTNPQGAEIDSFFVIWFGSILMWILGLAFAGTGIILVMQTFIRNSIIKGLEVSNRQIDAKITEIKRSSFGRKNRHPYIIYAEYEEGGNVHTFKSDPVPYDPTDMIKSPTIKVIVHLSDLKKYYVDVDSALQEPAEGEKKLM